MKKFLLIALTVFVILAIALIVYILSGIDNALTLREYSFESDDIKGEVKLAFISDLHCCEFGENNNELFEMLADVAPDAVILGGDIFDRAKPWDNGIKFIDGLVSLYPVYAVMGNHEYNTTFHTLDEMKNIYSMHGVTVLANKTETVEINGNKINLCGVDMPRDTLRKKWVDTTMEGVDTSLYTIAIYHRPDQSEFFVNRDVDLVLSGHAHGGQWRVPGVINGIIAPNQGLFPKYAGGSYELEGGMSMVVSRGLDISSRVPRVYNPPEIVSITVKGLS